MSETHAGYSRFFIRGSYITAIERAGGIPLHVGDVRNTRNLDALLDRCDGLLLPGGGDIHPFRYGEEVTGKLSEVEEWRDEMELHLIQEAYSRGIPVLGVCRGMQLINVYFGGTLYQDIATEHSGALLHTAQSADRSRGSHTIHVAEESLLAKIVPEREFAVNSIHHQGVKTLGGGLRVAARAPDGLVEAIEHPGHPFLLGVQWHPEELRDIAARGIFAEFIRHTKERAA